MDITIPPPQQYEIARLNEFKSIDKLLDFAMERSTEEALQLYLPVYKLNSFIDINHEANNHKNLLQYIISHRII